ncbi:MAG: hypothetical protein R3F24_04320 [Gammaproteobacteria bacterium]
MIAPTSNQHSELLPALQGYLGQLYDVPVPQDVRDYLVTDRAILDALTAGSRRRYSAEQLLVMEDGDSVDLALFIDSEVLDRLAATDPREHLSGANLADYWTLLEGISHFHYMAWNAALDKPVTLLELEMQAEVDKYVSTRFLLLSQPGSALGAPLMQRLFDEPALDVALDADEIDRYKVASTLAERYCASLEARFPPLTFTPAMLRELRKFYRLSQTAKIARIRAGGIA